MRISVVHSFYSSATPSGENFMVDSQVAALTEAGHDVQLIALRTDDLQRDPLYKARTALTVATGYGHSPLDDLKKFAPEVVHVHNLFPNYSTQWLKQWSGPIVATMHNFRPLCSNGLLFRDGQTCTLCPDRGSHNAITHKCYKDSRIATLPVAYSTRGRLSRSPLARRADQIIVLADRARETYVNYGIDPEKITVVPNFIEDPRLTTNAQADENMWLYAGRLTQEKGIIDLLQQWPGEERLDIAGVGPEEKTVQLMAAKRENVNYVGSLHRPALLAKLSSAKGVVIPSLWAEGLPSVYLEALAAGQPVVSRVGNSAADDIQTWAPSLTYEDRLGLHAALKYANDDRKQLSLGARRRFTGRYTKDVWLRRISYVYQTVQ
jgi:glycosyltransferase involved in cell wall biosynthesis